MHFISMRNLLKLLHTSSLRLLHVNSPSTTILTSKLESRIGIIIKNNIQMKYVASRNGISDVFPFIFTSEDSLNRLLKSIPPIVIAISFKCARSGV